MTRFRHWRLMATVALGASLMLAAGGCDWLQAGFSASGDNANPYEAALTASTVGSLTQRYTLESSTPPIIADGTLFSITSSGAVSAVRARDGLPTWTATLPAGAASGLAPDDSGTVFASAPGTLYALNAANGAVRWSDPIAGLSGVPLIDDGKIFVKGETPDPAPTYFVTTDDDVIAIDPTSGSTLWTDSFPDPDPGYNLLGAPTGIIVGSGYVALNDTAIRDHSGPPGSCRRRPQC